MIYTVLKFKMYIGEVLPQVDIEKRPNIWSLYFYTVGEIMKLYYVDEDYINELRNVDERVLLNKSSRPYLMILIILSP